MSSFSVWRPDCRLRPSRRERRLRLLLILLTLSALPVGHVPWTWLPPMLLVQGVLSWRLWRHPGASDHLLSLQSTPLGWRLVLPDGSLTFADVHGPVRDWPGVLCLCFRERPAEVRAGERARVWRLVLWSDQLPAADWRRLRVSLRWRRLDQPGLPDSAPGGSSTVSQHTGPGLG